MPKDKREICVERVLTDENFGLNNNQVEERVAAGLTNAVKNYNSKSYGKIFFDNVCTFYNLLCLACFVALLAVHNENTPLSNYAFIIIYVANITIGIFQEIRAKRTLEKLSLVATPSVTVVRDGEERLISVNDVVADDVIKLSLGMQVPADCVVLSGVAKADESLLTGESVPINKTVGDKLLGGSFLTSGNVIARAEKVGSESYVQTLMKKAKKFKKTNSELLKAMKRIINFVGILIVPIAVLSAIINYNYLTSLFTGGELIAETVKATTAVMVGMIPGGMFLLTTVALAVGIVKLSRENTLVQDMYSLEMLARVNMLCLDKTGTITDGKLKVIETFEIEKCPYNAIIANMQRALMDTNVTAKALIEHFISDESYVATEKLNFNSKNKFSAVTFEDQGTYLLGAPEKIVTCPPQSVADMISAQTNKGRRVLMLAKTDAKIYGDAVDVKNTVPLMLIALEDNVRPEAVETIDWFKKNDVAIRVISGDDPVTVARISERAGVPDAKNCISLSGLNDEQVVEAAKKYCVFGRVSPAQKALIIKTLKAEGCCVAMTGDGVNDILAMKEADCSITFATGNSATKSLAHVVLMTDDFNCMPRVVKEGRRVINNVERSSALYVMKTAFIILLAVASIIIGRRYPLTTGDILILESMIIGLPSIALAVQPNKGRVKGKFLNTVLANALPGTFILLFNVFLAQNAHLVGVGTQEISKTLVVLALTFGGLSFLFVLCLPLDVFRFVLVTFITIIVTFWAIFLSNSPLFKLPPIVLADNIPVVIGLAFLFAFDIPIVWGVKKLFKYIFSEDKKNPRR